MTPEQLKIARHALGLPNDRRHSYRNRYAATVGSKQEAAWDAMVAAGHAERGDSVNVLSYFHLTLAGARASLEPKETLDLEDFPGADVSAEAER